MMTAPTVMSSAASVWSQSMAPLGQARTQLSHSLQTAQFETALGLGDGLLGAVAAAHVAPVAAANQAVDHGHGHALPDGDGGELLVAGTGDLALVVPHRQQPLAAQEVVDGGAPRRPAATASMAV